MEELHSQAKKISNYLMNLTVLKFIFNLEEVVKTHLILMWHIHSAYFKLSQFV